MLAATRPFSAPVVWAALAFAAGSGGALAQGRDALAPDAVEKEARTQRGLVVRQYLEDLKRVETVGYAVARVGAPYCKDKRRLAGGVTPKNRNHFKGEYQNAAVEALALGDALRFLHVAEGTPFAVAGVQENDDLVALQDETFAGDGAERNFEERFAALGKGGRTVALRVRRGADEVALSVQPHNICDVILALGFSDAVNAQASDRAILVTRGMLRFVQSDDELALVIGHELAHIALKHYESRKAEAQARVGVSIFGILLGVRGLGNIVPRAHPQDRERDADYIGLYLGAAAGYRYLEMPGLWRRMAAIHPASIEGSVMRTHPAAPERFLALDRTVEEIKAKVDKAEPLRPELATLKTDFSDEYVTFKGGRTKPRADIAARKENPRLYDIHAVPFLNEDGKISYEKFLRLKKRPRAFALAENGRSASRSGADAVRNAKLACERHARQCWLYAVDDQVVWDEQLAAIPRRTAPPGRAAAAPVTHERMPPQVSSFARLEDALAVPTIGEVGRRAYLDFLNSAKPRAFALSAAADYAWRSGTPHVMREALLRCEEAAATTCWLYAVDDAVVWIPEPSARDNTTLPTADRPKSREPACDPARVDPRLCDVSAVPVPSEGKARYRFFLTIKERPRTFVVSANGAWRMRWGPGAAARALDECQKAFTGCRVYAQDDRVLQDGNSAQSTTAPAR